MRQSVKATKTSRARLLLVLPFREGWKRFG